MRADTLIQSGLTHMGSMLAVLAGTEHSVDKDIEQASQYVPATAHTIRVGNVMVGGISPIGYGGFSSVWCFDAHGKFLAVGHYE